MEDPTTIFSDSVTAIDWAKFGKITPGNNSLALAYHQVREWVENNTVHTRGWDNISDLGTKPVEKQVIDRHLRFYVGLEDTLPVHIPPVLKEKLKLASRRRRSTNDCLGCGSGDCGECGETGAMRKERK